MTSPIAIITRRRNVDDLRLSNPYSLMVVQPDDPTSTEAILKATRSPRFDLYLDAMLIAIWEAKNHAPDAPVFISLRAIQFWLRHSEKSPLRYWNEHVRKASLSTAAWNLTEAIMGGVAGIRYDETTVAIDLVDPKFVPVAAFYALDAIIESRDENGLVSYMRRLPELVVNT